jgi:hypothetical protein
MLFIRMKANIPKNFVHLEVFMRNFIRKHTSLTTSALLLIEENLGKKCQYSTPYLSIIPL